MDAVPEWKLRFEQELKQAEAARARGNEGMARVCARRAAGIAAGEYLRGKGLPQPGPSAYGRLRALLDLPALPAPARAATGHLLMRVNVEHDLPVAADLLGEARQLAGALLGWEP